VTSAKNEGMTLRLRDSRGQYRDHAYDPIPEQCQLACDQGMSSSWKIERDLGRVETYQLQSPSHRGGSQVFPEIEMSCEAKYERERMFCGAIYSYE